MAVDEPSGESITMYPKKSPHGALLKHFSQKAIWNPSRSIFDEDNDS